MTINSKSFDSKRRAIGAVLGPVVATRLWFVPIDALSPIAHHLLAIMSLVAIWWITEPVPIPVTSLLGPTLCVTLGVAPAGKAFASFANPMIFLFMGGFLLAKGMMVNGLDKRIAYGILSMKWVGDSPRRIFLASSLGFMMPVSTPPNAIVYASGYVPITKMIKSGFIIDVIGVFCITIPLVLVIVKAVMGV